MSNVMLDPTPLGAIAALPRRRLAPFPTPLLPAPALGRAIGLPGLWLKRDDLISFGLGGNKVRGLEFLLGDALTRDADVLVTGAGTASNHVRATAAAAALAGLETIAVYWGDEPRTARGNFALTRLLGANAVFTHSADRASVDAHLSSLERELRAGGRRPYVIPRGGACALGAAGHALAVAELRAQCAAEGIEPSAVVLAVGSGGTQAGWLTGIAALRLPWRVEGVTVSRPAGEARARIRELAGACARLADFAFDERACEPRVHEGFIGEGYGIPTAEGNAAIALAARHEGTFLDPTYTGKALAGLRALVDRGTIRASETVVFVHTGGTPTLLAQEETL